MNVNHLRQTANELQTFMLCGQSITAANRDIASCGLV
jgi:hypothetical protein